MILWLLLGGGEGDIADSRQLEMMNVFMGVRGLVKPADGSSSRRTSTPSTRLMALLLVSLLRKKEGLRVS